MRIVIFNYRYPFVRIHTDDSAEQIAELRAEIESLRERLVEAQESRANALGQAEALRREKETLRERNGAMRQELKDQARILAQVEDKIQQLRQELENAMRPPDGSGGR